VSINPHNPFKGRQFPGEVIVLCVRWYLRYPPSYQHVTELVAERGVEYLYRALDSTGQTIDFLLTAKTRYRRRAFEASGDEWGQEPAYPAAVEALKADGVIPQPRRPTPMQESQQRSSQNFVRNPFDLPE
jgi:hypothetical protein